MRSEWSEADFPPLPRAAETNAWASQQSLLASPFNNALEREELQSTTDVPHGWKVKTSKKRRAGPPRNPPLSSRPRILGPEKTSMGVGTADATPNPFNAFHNTFNFALANTGANPGPSMEFQMDPLETTPPFARAQPLPPAPDGVPCLPPVATSTPRLEQRAIPERNGSSGAQTTPMDVDRPLVAVPPGAPSPPRSTQATDSARTLDLSLRHFSRAPLNRQFDEQTPRQEQDVLSRRLAPIPARAPALPPIAGPYTVRDVPTRSRTGRGTSREATAGDSPYPATSANAPRGGRPPLAAIQEEARDGLTGEEQRYDDENMPPPSMALSRARSLQPPALAGPGLNPPRRSVQPMTHQSEVRGPPQANQLARRPLPEGAARPDFFGPPQGQLPPPPLSMQQPTTQIPFRPLMPEPRGGYPLVRFNDYEALLEGTDPPLLRDLRAGPELSALIVFFPMVLALPHDDMVSEFNNRISVVSNELIGEPNVWLVPPRPPPNATPDDPIPRAWFMQGMTPEGAQRFLDIFAVSCPLMTFFVYPLAIEPELILTLGGFASNVGNQIENLITTTFHSMEVRNIIAQHVAMNQIFDDMDGVSYVLETLDVEILALGNRTFIANVIMLSPATTAENHRLLRDAIARIPFQNAANAPASPRWYVCEVCAGNDHPTHACRFFTLPGWVGPVPQQEQSRVMNQPGSAMIFLPRRASTGQASGSLNNNRGTRGRGRGAATMGSHMNGGRGGGQGPSSSARIRPARGF